MTDLDIDLKELERIKDPSIRFIVNQLRINGFAATSDNSVSRRISKRLPEFREKKTILMAPDRRSDVNIISVNPSLVDPGRELERFIKKIMKVF
jgi:hypothetical protein